MHNSDAVLDFLNEPSIGVVKAVAPDQGQFETKNIGQVPRPPSLAAPRGVRGDPAHPQGGPAAPCAAPWGE